MAREGADGAYDEVHRLARRRISVTLCFSGRRVVTAAVCRDWAAVHADSSSGIWEAVNLHAETQRTAEEVLPGDTVRRKTDRRGLVSLGVWLAARAQAVRQLQFCETEAGVTAATRTALVRCRCPAKTQWLAQDGSGI